MKRPAALFLSAALLLSARPSAALQVLTNGVYSVHLGTEAGESVGSWNAVTAENHPAGAGHDLLFDGDWFDTNYSSLRVWGPDGGYQDYTTAVLGGTPSLGDYLVDQGPSPYGSAGWQLEWLVPGDVRVVQDVVLPGQTFSSSAIYHSVRLTNEGPGAVAVGWRNLYDWAVHDPEFDDGPSNRIERLDGTVAVDRATAEFEWAPGAGEFVRVGAYPLQTGAAPSYEALLALGFDPGLLPELPVTRPDRYAFASWPGAYGTTQEYFVDPNLAISLPWTDDGTQTIDDTAGLSWFGPVALAPGESVAFTQAIFGVLPGAPPPSTVPEPGTLALLGSGLVFLARRSRRA